MSSLGSALIAWAHFLAIFSALLFLAVEWALYVPALSLERLNLLRRIDLGYLFAALAIIATGVTRVLTSPKGTAFYTHNPVFWIKMSLFVVVALLSIAPTVHYLRLSASGSLEIPVPHYRRVRRFILAQLAVFAFIPLAATLMARGVGL